MQIQSGEIGSPLKKVVADAAGSVSSALKDAKRNLGHCGEEEGGEMETWVPFSFLHAVHHG